MKQKQGRGKIGRCPQGMDLLLPWHLTHTLEEAEEEKIKKHLRSCSICRQELKKIKHEQRLYRSAAEETPIPHTFPHIIADIEQRHTKAGIWQRIASLIPGPQPVLAATVTIQFFVIIGLVSLLVLNPWGTGEKIYRTLAGPSIVEGKGPHLAILFQERVREKEVREIILEIEGTIMNGPTKLGIYTVALKREMRPEELQNLIATLRQKKDIIRFVEVRGE